MPIPKPQPDEDEKTFINRCLGDDVMVKEYPDEKQRSGVCYTAWGKDKKAMDTVIERRYIPITDAKFRMETVDEKPILRGYFALFNSLSRDLGGFQEVIKPGFFRKALASPENDVVDLFNHDPNYILGRKSAGTLRVWEDEIGLAFECIPPDTQTIRDLVLSPIERGDLKGCSFAFTVGEKGDIWERRKGAPALRTLVADGCADLSDGSQVTHPAYPQASVQLRSLLAELDKDTVEDLPIPEAGAKEDEVEGAVDCSNDLKRIRFKLL